MTGQDLLNLMEMLDNELQLQVGEADVVRGLRALNASQDYMESLIAQKPGFLGDGLGTVTTTGAQDYTVYPAGLLRLDLLQRQTDSGWTDLDSLDNPISEVYHDWLYLPSGADGAPEAYWTNGTNIYWTPTPDITYTIRWFGMMRKSDLTTGSTFGYDDLLSLPLAAFAVRLLKQGIEDQVNDIYTLARETFDPALAALAGFRREQAPGKRYRYHHTT